MAEALLNDPFEAPLEALLRLLTGAVQAPAASPAGAKPSPATVEEHLRNAVQSTLRGDRTAAEGALHIARARSDGAQRLLVELAAALAMVEAGSPARAAGALERAEGRAELVSSPAANAVAQALHAQLLLDQGAPSPARTAALSALTLVSGGSESLTAYLRWVAAAVLVAAGDEAAGALLEAPATGGVLGARQERLRARVLFGAGRLQEARAALTRAMDRLEDLGAPRDLGLTLLDLAELPTTGGEPAAAGWVARAQPLLAQAGSAVELQKLRLAFRTHGRRRIDRLVSADVLAAIEGLRGERRRLRDALEAQRDAREVLQSTRLGPRRPADLTVDHLLDAVHTAEDDLILALESTLLDRDQVSRLVEIAQQISSLETTDELLGRMPRLACALIDSEACELVEPSSGGESLRRVSGSPAAPWTEALLLAVCNRILAGQNAAFFDTKGEPVEGEPEAGAVVLVPVRGAGSLLVLCLRLATRGGARDLEQLTLFGSLAGAAIARARSREALTEAAARDGATLAAIRDGVISLDGSFAVRTANAGAQRILHQPEGALVGQRLSEISGLRPLFEALAPGKPLAGEVVMLPSGGLLVRAQPYPGGMVVILQELSSAQRLAQRLVGSRARFTFEDLVGRTPELLATIEDARRAAQSDVPILVTGESGTGKELLAQAIHNASPRAGSPFIGINVAAVPRELLESELFGYEAGAFTGARAGGNPGKFELVEDGTLLLDEIGDMPLEMQAKLLRVLQERSFQRLGGARSVPLRARIIATTHRDLQGAVEAGTFRLDLFHRLRVVHLRLPALRQRREDVPLLAEHHLRAFARRLGRGQIRIGEVVVAALCAHDWPGNVRELANLIEGAASLLPVGVSAIEELPPTLRGRVPNGVTHGAGPGAGPGAILPLDEVERRAFADALRQLDGNVSRAARALGVAKGTLYNKMRRWGLKPTRPGGR